MSGCARFHDSLGAFHDGELAEPQAAELARHLQQCGACRTELAQLEWLDGSLRALPRSEPSPELAARVHARVAELAPQLAPRSARRAPRRLEQRAGWAAAALCAAAAALLFLRGGEERLSREDWQLLADADTFELLLSEDPELLTEDPELLLALDLLERWDD
jgi:anti-sigma factor RsiW